ncbi:MAG: hypothetical protein M0Z93_10000, partial [Actinomycetota bacterium]|nr:hypothetical protein [Actinomycetota bacterium]
QGPTVPAQGPTVPAQGPTVPAQGPTCGAGSRSVHWQASTSRRHGPRRNAHQPPGGSWASGAKKTKKKTKTKTKTAEQMRGSHG